MLLRSILAPMGVKVWFKSPKRQSLDLILWRFWISSREAMVERSIIMVSSDGWYLILKECGANLMENSDSRYRIAYDHVSFRVSDSVVY